MKRSIPETRALGRVGLLSALIVGLAVAGGPAIAQDYPSERLNWTIAFGPGGGNDIMSRTIIDILEKYELYPAEIVAENKPGGSGALGWGYLFNQKGNPYHISSTSGSFITTPLNADTPWQPTDFTPIALLASDDLVIVVNAKSDIQTFEDFIEKAKASQPAIGGMGTVNIDFIIPTLLAEKAGFKFDYVNFNEQGELTTALLSESLDAMMVNPGEVLGLIEAGDFRALAYTGKKTPEALGDLPTLAELGYENEISTPRGLVLPPDVPKEAQDWWIETARKIVETPEWKEYLKKQLITENTLYGEDFRDFLANSQDTFAKILRAKGAIK